MKEYELDENSEVSQPYPSDEHSDDDSLDFRIAEFGNLAWPTSAVCFGPPLGTLMLRELGSAGA